MPRPPGGYRPGVSADPRPADAAPDDGPVAAAVHGLAEVGGDVVDATREAAEAVRRQGEVVADAAQQAMEVTAQAAEVAETHAAMSTGARVGFFLDGLLHALMGWAGLQLVWLGRSSSTADESGALIGIAGSLGGRAVLWVAFGGFVVVAVWNLARGITGRHCRTRMKRFEHAADGIAYATVAWSAAAFAVGAGQTSRQSTVGMTRTMLALPGGVLLVIGTGLAVVGVGAFSIWSGVSRDFLVDLATRPGRVVVAVGILGFVARGIVYGVVGALFVAAAVTHDVRQSTGIDGALHVMQGVPGGEAMLTVLSVGLIAFGIYLMTRARHLLA